LTFDQLSNEAKLLFVIGEPLRRLAELSFDEWINRTAFEWVQVVGREDVTQFCFAFDELAEWLKGKETTKPSKLTGQINTGQLEMF